MALTYSQFKTHVADMLWRSSDTDLLNAMDTLILTADAEIARALDVEYRTKAEIVTLTGLDQPLPTDYYSMKEIYGVDLNRGEFLYVPPAELKWEREIGSTSWNPIYSLEGDNILFCGPFDSGNPAQFSLTYQRSLPDYAADDASWLADKYLDLYTYAVLKHAGIYSREDERVQTYDGLYQQAVTNANLRSAMSQSLGKQADMQLPTVAGVRHAGSHVRTRSRGSYKVRGTR